MKCRATLVGDSQTHHVDVDASSLDTHHCQRVQLHTKSHPSSLLVVARVLVSEQGIPGISRSGRGPYVE